MLIGFLTLGMKLNAATIAGIGLWSLALYLGFSPLSEAVMERLDRALRAIGRRTRGDNSSFELAALLASLLSVIPFLLIGWLCNWGVELGLGRSWAISMGILACMGGGVYELGRRDGQAAAGRGDD